MARPSRSRQKVFFNSPPMARMWSATANPSGNMIDCGAYPRARRRKRGAPSARALQDLDLEAVYVVVDGFEGSSSKTDPNGPHRNVSGWKNSGLPWSFELNTEKVFVRTQ